MSFDPKIIGHSTPAPQPSVEDEALGEALSREAAMLASRYPGDPHKQRPRHAATRDGNWLPWLAALATCIAVMTTAGIVWQTRGPAGDSGPAIAAPSNTPTQGERAPLNPPIASATPVPSAESLPTSQAELDARERLKEIEAEIERQRTELERLKEDIRRVESQLSK